MKVGDLIEYIEPGLELCMGRGIIIAVRAPARNPQDTQQYQVMWDEGHITWIPGGPFEPLRKICGVHE